MTTATRPVRIHLAMKDGPLPRSIRQVLPIVGNESVLTYVEKISEADLVIFTEVRDIERGYNKDTAYAYLVMPGTKTPTLPDNCEVIDSLNIMVGLINVIAKARQKLTPVEATQESEPKAAALRPDALRILVIDDTPKHIASAESGLAGHKLTTVTSYEEAMDILGSEKFDVVLTDLHLPMSSKTMGSKFKLGELVPYGILLMVEAARQGAKHVAVVTDLNHHDDPFSAAFDHYSHFPVQIEGAKVVMMHAPMNGDGSKNWAAALSQLIEA